MDEGFSIDFFSLVVMNITETLDGSAILVSGNLHGTLSKGDSLYVVKPDNKFFKAEVTAMEAFSAEGKTEVTDSATNCTVRLSLKLEDENAKLNQLDVLTNIEPMEKVDVNKKVENPLAAGLLFELARLGKNQAYNSVLTYALTHSSFITPLRLEKAPEDNGDGTATFKKDTIIGFYMLKSGRKDANEETGENAFLLPVFTDWRAIGDWKGLKEKNEKINTMIVTFPDAVTITQSPNFAGFVVNPFSENQAIIDKKLLEVITNMEGYKRDFPGVRPAVPMSFHKEEE
ncbi:MAG: SseB family protein [Pseudobutyrivibrio sp.]|nr:SseB family protein [Pseudobutyrivibrio sp.]